MNLPSLHGYVKFPEGFPAARIRLSGATIPKSPNHFCARPTCNWPPMFRWNGNDGAEGEGGDGGPAPVVGSGEQAMVEPDP
jgi:hypothetical protein